MEIRLKRLLRLWAGYGQVMGRLWAGYGQVTGRGRVPVRFMARVRVRNRVRVRVRVMVQVRTIFERRSGDRTRVDGVCDFEKVPPDQLCPSAKRD